MRLRDRISKIWACNLAAFLCVFVATSSLHAEAIAINHQRELFVDGYLVDHLDGVSLRFHAPVDRGIALDFGEKPWEKRYVGYGTVIYTGDLYQMYYRSDASLVDGTYGYAESTDGIEWTRPNLGIVEFDGSKNNNLILKGRDGSHSFSPFLDQNPQSKPDQRYKAIGLRRTANGKRWELLAFASPDGKHWKLMQDEPVMTDDAFDSQNVPFWSAAEGRYVLYYRTKANRHTGTRLVARAVSDDFIHWTPQGTMEYRRLGEEVPTEQMYINQTHPYFRAPHIYVSTAARFMQSHPALTDEQAAQIGPGNFKDCSDAVLMTTRGGLVYDRTFMEGWVRPGIGYENWGTRSNYPFLGVVPTGDTEMSVYVVKAYGLPNEHVRRYTLRLDGFASINAPYDGGEMISKPLICPGDSLNLNYATSAAGSVRVELLDEQGTVIPGYSLEDCEQMIGDQIARPVKWRGASDLGSLTGKVIRLRFVMKDADLYALQFAPVSESDR